MKSSANDVSELMVARLLRIGSKLTKWHLFQFSITYWGISKFENSFRILFIWQLIVLLRVTGWKKSRGFRVSPKKYSNVMISVQKNLYESTLLWWYIGVKDLHHFSRLSWYALAKNVNHIVFIVDSQNLQSSHCPINTSHMTRHFLSRPNSVLFTSWTNVTRSTMTFCASSFIGRHTRIPMTLHCALKTSPRCFCNYIDKLSWLKMSGIQRSTFSKSK